MYKAMKKAIIYLALCFLLVLGAFLAWACYKDVLAAALLAGAFIPSALFGGELEEIKVDKDAGHTK